MSQYSLYEMPIPKGIQFCEGDFECEHGGYRLVGQWCIDWNDRGNARAFLAGLTAVFLGDEEIEYLTCTTFEDDLECEFRVQAYESEFPPDDD